MAPRQRPDFGKGSGHLGFIRYEIGLIRPGQFARRRIDVFGRMVFRPRFRPERDGGKVGGPAVIGPRDEPNDLCAHENPSHTAIAIRAVSASEIR